MTVKDILNKSTAANFLIDDYMIWKHSEGWSAVNIKTQKYYNDVEDWIRNRDLVTDNTGRNYWTDIEKLLENLPI
jgi:hypothetical protein